MSQTFEYPNLLKGSRSGVGWKYDNGGMRNEYPNGNKQHTLYNSTNKENFIVSPLVSLKHGITYTLSVYTTNSENCVGSDIYVLYEKVVTGWIAAYVYKCAKGPRGGVGHFYVRDPRCLPGRVLLHQVRQQRFNRWPKSDHLVRQPYALRCLRTTRMGSGRRGGVAVNE